MARPHIEFIRSQDVEETDAEAPFTGLRQRLLSADEESGAYTALLEIPAGSTVELGGSTRPFEIFGLRGELKLGADRFGAGCYVYLESELPSATLTAEEDALLLMMVEDERASTGTGSWEVKDTEQMDYEVTEFDGQIPPGLVIKMLRLDPELNEWSWVCASVPNRVTPVIEVHSTVEEAFLIRGDLLMGERGPMSPGCYFWRPGMVRHGPMITRGGDFWFLRTKGGGLDLETEEAPGWEEQVHAYRTRQPYYAG